MNKKTTKKTSQTFEVNLVWCTTPSDIYAAFGLAKQQAGLPMTNTEFSTIVFKIIDAKTLMKELICSVCELFQPIEFKYEQKKPNIFKRFWNWITRKK